MKRALLLSLLLAAGNLQAQDQALIPDHVRAMVDTICAACHMGTGNGVNESPENPKLAGQHAEYLYKQMKDYKSAEGRPPARENGVMNGMIVMLPDDESLRAAARFYAAQKLEPAQAKNNENTDSFKIGRNIWRAGIASKGLPACAACHGPKGKGIPSQYPAMAGQFPEYLEAQLRAFRDGTRTNDKMMQDIALKMTDLEIKAVSDYAAGLR